MPVPVGVVSTPPPPPPIILPTPVIDDAFTMTWVAPDNTVWPLMTPEVGWHLLDAIAGVHDAVDVNITADDDPDFGETVRNTHPETRIMTLPVRIDGPDPAVHLTRYRGLERAFTICRRLGPGTIILARPDGTARQIRARYAGGFGPTPGDLSGWLYSTVILTLRCSDPYWQDLAAIPFERGFESAAADYQNPYFSISSAQTLGDTTITNPGDAEAWPNYVITGPATLITATRTRTVTQPDGSTTLETRTWTIDPNATGIAHGNLLAGETVTISSKPLRVRGPAGDVWTAALGFPDNADLWPLEPGDNNVTLAIIGAAAGTSITGSFVPRWETP